jgi:NodT family efflux transporter outer membrane factor (OMF) lipoprotein
MLDRVFLRPAMSALHAGVSLAAAALVAGCAVGPNYKAPVTQLAPFHNLPAAAAAATTPPPPLEEWWRGFDDPMLLTVVQRALDQNLDLAGALARVQQARAEAAGAGAALAPTLDLGATATAERQSRESPFGQLGSVLPGAKRDSQEYAIGPAASWELDLFGGLRREASAAREEAQAAEAERAGTRISVAADAADAYIQIRGFQARLAVAQQQVDTNAKLLEVVKVRYDAGQADGREVSQADALLKDARSRLQPLRIGLEVQLNRLDVLMGAQPGTYAQELKGPGQIPNAPGVVGSDQSVDIVRRRPDIIAAERRLAASNERIGAAISDYYPKISLSGLVGFDSVSINKLFTANAVAGAAAGALRWRLFDFGKVDAEVKQARGTQAEALAAYRKTLLRAAEDVEDALVTLVQLQEQERELESQLVSLTRARDLSQRAYEADSIPLTDVLDANRQLLSLTDQLDETRAATARAAVGAFRAFGGGWSPPTSAAATAPQRS